LGPPLACGPNLVLLAFCHSGITLLSLVIMSLQRISPLILTILLVACQPAVINTPAPQTATELPAPTATASPSPSPLPATPTETVAPAPLAFTEQFDGSLPYWTFQQIDNGQLAPNPLAEGGFLVFALTGPNQWVYAFYRVPTFADVRVDAQVEIRATGESAFGIVCRYSEEQGWYELNVYPDQTYALLFGQWLAPALARYTPLFRNGSEKIKADSNQIGLLCQGDMLTPFINGVKMRSLQEDKFGLKEGKIGVSAASFESVPLTVAYDWVKVSEP
jgi:hypothetical protein